ncbi:hypothetical protein FRB90_004754 [Tulasnella sp. 427]|nr:hypothetical protein FRB90_004754 [Tulasnella sp. 427]
MAEYAGAQMIGAALRWHMSLPRDVQANWRKLEIAVLDRFAPEQPPATVQDKRFDLICMATGRKPGSIRYSDFAHPGTERYVQTAVWKVGPDASVTLVWPPSPDGAY